MVEIYNKYCIGSQPKARMLTIYIDEAHAKDDWALPKAFAGAGGEICVHKSIEDRLRAGTKFIQDFDYPIEMVCDGFDGDAMDIFEAWPERLYVVSSEGRVLYKGDMGPFGYKPEEVDRWLDESTQ